MQQKTSIVKTYSIRSSIIVLSYTWARFVRQTQFFSALRSGLVQNAPSWSAMAWQGGEKYVWVPGELHGYAGPNTRQIFRSARAKLARENCLVRTAEGGAK